MIGIIYWKKIRVAKAEWDVGPDDMYGTGKVKIIVPFKLHPLQNATSTEIEKRVRNAFFEKAMKLKWPISGAWQSWFTNELETLVGPALVIIIDTSSLGCVKFFQEKMNGQSLKVNLFRQKRSII